MEHLKKDDIIFNHEQTEDLKEKGKISGHGKLIAHAEGTFSGMGAYAIGSGSGGTRRTSSSSSSSSSSSDSSSDSDSDSDSTDPEYLDWIEIKIERLEREIENLGTIAEGTWRTWEERSSSLADEISKVTDEISLQESAANTYLKQANSIDLSEEYKQKVREGKLEIESITDETLQKNIESYQEW